MSNTMLLYYKKNGFLCQGWVKVSNVVQQKHIYYTGIRDKNIVLFLLKFWDILLFFSELFCFTSA